MLQLARLLFLLILLMPCTVPHDAQAQAPSAKVGRVAPGTATSNCLGANTSPTCLTETLLACFARIEPTLCRQAGIADTRVIAREPRAVEYLIDRISIVRAEDITDDLRDVEWFKPGFALAELRWRACHPSAADCAGETWDDLQVYMRPHGSAWEIVTWRGESEQEGVPELPDSFRPARPQ
jgi:hypothetical protein